MNLTDSGDFACFSPPLDPAMVPAGGALAAVALRVVPNGADAVESGTQFLYYNEVNMIVNIL
jgi:hypothetical protein